MEADTGNRQAGPPGELGSPGESLRGFPGRLWSLATSPGQFFREVPGPGGYASAVLFATFSVLAIPLVLGVIGAVIGIPIALIVAASEGGSMAGTFGVIGIGLLVALVGLMLMPLFIAIGLFVGACIQHLFVLLFAGPERRSFGETFKLLAYAASPAAFISWIPIVGFFGWIWQIVLAVIGIKEVHRTSTGRAVLAVAAPMIIVLLLSLAIAVSAAILSGSAPAQGTAQGAGAAGPGASGSGAPPTVQAPQAEQQDDAPSGSGQSDSTPSGAASAQAAGVPGLSTDTSPGVTVQNVGFYRDEIGTLKFYGEVLNEGEDDLVAPQVTIKLYNDKDEIVGQMSALGPLPTVIEPGQRGVWDAILSGEDAPEDWSRTEVEAIEDEALAETYAQMYYPELEASNARLKPAEPYSTPTVTAEVSNTGEQAPDTVLASAAIYDEEGKLVDVSSMSSAGSMTVRPGESSLFEGYVDNPGVDPDKDYDVAVYLDGTRPLQ